jgi:hypothetical protein
MAANDRIAFLQRSMTVISPNLGRYEGRPSVVFLSDGRRVKTIEPFAFIDAASLRWEVPSEVTVDGASIPRLLWTLVGGPFEGKYRDASIIHDWYCDIRDRHWRAVHKVFYEAMLASDVPSHQAKLMYAGVLFGGPRWSETVVENVNLNRGGTGADHRQKPGDRVWSGSRSSSTKDAVKQNISRGNDRVTLVKATLVSTLAIRTPDISNIKDLIESEDPDIAEIEKLVEDTRADLLKRHPEVQQQQIVPHRKTRRPVKIRE